jgi:hypothetical protein
LSWLWFWVGKNSWRGQVFRGRNFVNFGPYIEREFLLLDRLCGFWWWSLTLTFGDVGSDGLFRLGVCCAENFVYS